MILSLNQLYHDSLLNDIVDPIVKVLQKMIASTNTNTMIIWDKQPKNFIISFLAYQIIIFIGIKLTKVGVNVQQNNHLMEQINNNVILSLYMEINKMYPSTYIKWESLIIRTIPTILPTHDLHTKYCITSFISRE